MTFTFIINTDSENKTITSGTAKLMKAIQKGRVVAMDKDAYIYVCERVAKSPKSSWIKGLAKASLIEYTPLK